VKGISCGALQPDMRCGVYERRPAVCRVYPYSVHAGRRVQATVTLACPGVGEAPSPLHPREPHAVHPVGDVEDMAQGAREVVALVLAQPGAAEMAREARETFAEFDRRMKEWGVAAAPDRLRAAFLPHAERLSRPAMLPAFFAGLEGGDLLLDGKPARAVEALFDAEPESDLADLVAHAAEEAFGGQDDALWVEPDFAWSQPRWTEGRVELVRHRRERGRESAVFDLAALPLDWSEEATRVLTAYLTRLLHRDHTEGAAAWLVDASGYQATLPAAYARVLAEASLQVTLRAGLLAREAGVDEVTDALARRGVSAYETSFHSLPTLGSIL
jgi:Fe-S-cluster containining protein